MQLKVSITDNGQDYTNATILPADIIEQHDIQYSSASSNSSLTFSTNPVFEVIIGPDGGHGSNPAKELGGHFALMDVKLAQTESFDFSVVNDFRQVGIVRDPYSYGTSSAFTNSTARQTYVVKIDTNSGTFEPDEVITQASTGAVGKVVEFDSTRSLLFYQQEEFKGFGTVSTSGNYVAFSGTNQITGATSGATGTTAGTTETVTLLNSNTVTLTSGYANPELAADSGNIIYLENRKPIQRASDQTEDIKVIIEF